MSSPLQHPELELIQQMPSGPPHSTPLLFVHGGWHAAWCWEHFLPYFAARGYAAYALSLRGHGASGGNLRWASAAHDYVADVAEAVAMLPAPPVLIGHSMGGYVVQKYLEQYTAPAAVLLAPIPVAGTLGLAWRYLLRHPRACLRTIHTADPWQLIGTAALAHDAFFSRDLPHSAIVHHVARLKSESRLVMLEAAFNPPRPHRITTPVRVLGATNDRIFTQREIEATAHAYGTHATFFPMAHDLMLEPGWEDVAAAIADWVERVTRGHGDMVT